VPDSDASTWGFHLTNSAKGNYGKACGRQQGSGNLFAGKIVLPFPLSPRPTIRLPASSQGKNFIPPAINFQIKIFIFHFAINLTLLNLSK
jgi:hypothetical protein